MLARFVGGYSVRLRETRRREEGKRHPRERKKKAALCAWVCSSLYWFGTPQHTIEIQQGFHAKTLRFFTASKRILRVVGENCATANHTSCEVLLLRPLIACLLCTRTERGEGVIVCAANHLMWVGAHRGGSAPIHTPLDQ